MTVIPTYFVSPCPQLWHLADGGDAFVWTAEGRTAVLAKEVALLIEKFVLEGNDPAVVSGLPPMTVLLLLLAAAETKAANKRDFCSDLNLLASVAGGGSNKLPIETTAAWLTELGKLPQRLVRGTDARGRLLKVLFERLQIGQLAADGHQTVVYVTWLHVHASERVSVPPAQPNAAGARRAISCLAFLAGKFPSVASLQTELETGLTDLAAIEEPAEEQPPVEDLASLLNRLREDEQLGVVARMSLSASATLTLLRRPSDADQIPAGGVSDISNRGHPEQLLMTELAADPMLLLARIAHGQALYLRREKPPAADRSVRPIVIESSIRTWGETRVRCLAFALAIATSEQRRGAETRVWTIDNHQSHDEDLATREGIVAQVSRLSPGRHPGKGLEALCAEAVFSSEEMAEPILIVAGRTFTDPNFVSSASKLPLPYLIAKIDRDGKATLLRRTHLGDEPIHQQRLRIDHCATPPKPQSDLPLFETLGSPRPLRVTSQSSDVWQCADVGPMLWLVDKRRRLLCFDEARRGAREVGELPGKVVLAHSLESGELALVIAQGEKRDSERYLLRCTSNAISSVYRLPPGTFTYAFDRGRLLQIADAEIHFLDPVKGYVLSKLAAQGRHALRRQHLGEAFFTTGSNHLALAVCEGNNPTWHDLGRCPGSIGFAIRDINGTPAAFAQNLKWHGKFGDGTAKFEERAVVHYGFSENAKAIAVDPRRERAVLSSAFAIGDWQFKPFNAVVNLTDGSTVRASNQSFSNAVAACDPAAAALLQQKSVRTKLTDIATDGTTLYVKRDERKQYAIQESHGLLKLVECPIPSSAKSVEFSEHKSSTRDSRWRMKLATIGNGKVWLDRRGMLHLRNADGSELSLVLNDSDMAGWSSEDNTTFGAAYFTFGAPHSVPASVMTWLGRFANQCFESA